MNELSTIREKWEKLGKQLGVREWKLKDIHTKYSEPADCLRELFKHWLQLDLPTWNHVVFVLKNPNIGESLLGDYLKRKYCTGELLDTHYYSVLFHTI